ncbi:MAG TPA: alpha/beta fold hydrolase [Reyranellaceae bacterium]|nr:alpha/beta fold hydrolase [Reyranellaceae bacterium]
MPPSIASLELPPFKPRFPWWGADLQTVAVLWNARPTGLEPHASERVCFPMNDGSGDTLLGMLDTPLTPVEGRPLAVLIHGLTGSETSFYMLNCARHLLDLGFHVLRLNLRGAGPSRAFCREQYFIGRTADFRRVLQLLPEELTGDGVAAVGFSLGGAMLLKFLGEDGVFSRLCAAATVCAPLDLMRTCRHMMKSRNALYHRYLLAHLKAEATGEGAALTDEERANIRNARSLWDYDAGFIAPRHGFASAEEYYEICSPMNYLAEIRVPTLVLAAKDDPWVPAEFYSDFDWTMNPALVPLLAEGGGHVGFHGEGKQPWSDIAVGRFLQKACSDGA